MSRRLLRPLLMALAFIGRSLVAGDAPPKEEIVDLPPFQVLARSFVMRSHTVKRDGKEVMQYIRVEYVARGSVAEKAGLKKGDRIIAIAGWSVVGQELAAINRNFPTKTDGDDLVVSLTVQRGRKEELEVLLRFPRKPATDPARR